jgi:hypothetical protein
MTDCTELQRLTRLRRLSRQIAASLPADLELDQTFQVHGYVRDLPAGAARHLRKSSSSKAVLRAELEAAMANYRGRGHTLPTGRPAGARSD